MGLKSTADLDRRSLRAARKAAGHRNVQRSTRSPRTDIPTPRSRPVFWLHPGVGPGWRVESVKGQTPKGVLSLLTRARRLVWSWWPWAIVSIWRIAERDWSWAVAAGAWATLAYLTQPSA